MPFNIELAISLLPDMMRGLLITVALVPPCAVIGFLIALPVAVGETSGYRLARLPAQAFSIFFRGAPALIVLYMIYNGLPQVGLVRDTPLWEFFKHPINCAIVALSLNHAGFVTEILRGGLLAVPKGITEAAEAMSVPRLIIYLRIQLPLAFRYAFSAYRNEFIFLIKTTSLVGAVTVSDLLAVANEAIDQTYDPTTPLLVAAFFYWLLVNGAQVAFGRIETRLLRYAR